MIRKSAIAWLCLLAPVWAAAPKLNEGDAAPYFKAASTGGEVDLKDYRGKWLVLYFYPKAFTPGCTKEACALRDAHAKIQKRDAVVLGVSRDDLETQKKFKTENELPFELVSDADKAIAREYGVIGFGGMYQRRTFLIDPKGKIAKIFYAVTPHQHDSEVLDELRRRQDPDE